MRGGWWWGALAASPLAWFFVGTCLLVVAPAVGACETLEWQEWVPPGGGCGATHDTNPHSNSKDTGHPPIMGMHI